MTSYQKFDSLSFEEKKAKLQSLLKQQKLPKFPTTKVIRNSSYQFEQFPEVIALKEQEEQFSQQKIPYFKIIQGFGGAKIQIEKRCYINYASYDYLGFAAEPIVLKKVREALEQYGPAASSSRILTGARPIHQELENEISSILGVADAMVFVSGHATNVTTIGHLLRGKDLIIHDSLSHNSIIQGAILSKAQRLNFPHNDFQALDHLLELHRKSYERVLVVIEGVYSMDGDIPNLPELIQIKKRHKALLMIDEAHSIGVLGERGFGIGEHFNINREDVDIWMGTLSKTLASCGGYIAGSKALIHYMKYTNPGFLYSVALSPPDTAASLAAIQLLKKSSAKVATLRERAALFLKLCQKAGFNTGVSQNSAIIPVIIGNSGKTLAITNFLFEHGINAAPVLYPAVEEETARLRFFISSQHSEEEIQFTVKQMKKFEQNF